MYMQISMLQLLVIFLSSIADLSLVTNDRDDAVQSLYTLSSFAIEKTSSLLHHRNADGLSRLPLPSLRTNCPLREAEVFNVAHIDSLPVTFSQLEQATRRDPILSKVRRYAKQRWPTTVQECLQPYWNRRDELFLDGYVRVWGIRVIVPHKLREQMLSELHCGHQEAAKMKAVAQSYVWWPNIYKNLEEIGKNCRACQSVKSSPPLAPLHPWAWPERPWQRVHINFAGPLKVKKNVLCVGGHIL